MPLPACRVFSAFLEKFARSVQNTKVCVFTRLLLCTFAPFWHSEVLQKNSGKEEEQGFKGFWGKVFDFYAETLMLQFFGSPFYLCYYKNLIFERAVRISKTHTDSVENFLWHSIIKEVSIWHMNFDRNFIQGVICPASSILCKFANLFS